MLKGVQRRATEFSNHYLDFSRVGELIGTHHRYSWKETLTRGAIVASTCVGLYVGAQAVPDASMLARLGLATLGGAIGFTVSHTVAILPLIQKRRRATQACDTSKESIWTTLKQLSRDANLEKAQRKPFKTKIKDMIHSIMHYSLTTDERGNASMTWGARSRLMGTLAQKLDTSVRDVLASKDPSGDYQKKVTALEMWLYEENKVPHLESNSPTASPTSNRKKL